MQLRQESLFRHGYKGQDTERFICIQRNELLVAIYEDMIWKEDYVFSCSIFVRSGVFLCIGLEMNLTAGCNSTISPYYMFSFDARFLGVWDIIS